MPVDNAQEYAQQELIDKTDVEIKRKPLSQRSEDETPDFKEQIDYNNDQIDLLRREVFKYKEILDEQWEKNCVKTKCDDLEAQYKGQLEEVPELEFNLSVPVTMVKVDSLSRLGAKAFLESDPKFTVTPRPGLEKINWEVVPQRQADYLDYQFDEEINIKTPLRRCLHYSALVGIGLMKIPYVYRRKRRVQEEYYRGDDIEIVQGQEINRGLQAFLNKFPEAINPGNEGHWAYLSLSDRKDVLFESSYWDVVYNNPKPEFVDIRKFRCDIDADGYDGLCDVPIKIEYQKYTYWEMKRKEEDGDFINVDKIIYKTESDAEAEKKGQIKYTDQMIENWKHKKYDIIEIDYYFSPDGKFDPNEEERVKCWFDVDSKTFLGAFYYPYELVDCEYIPFYCKDKEEGFIKSGIGEDLTQSHIGQSAILNFMLTEAWLQLVTTPICREGSSVQAQFVEERWSPGVPIVIPKDSIISDEIDFLDKPNTNVTSALINTLLFLNKYDDDRTGISSLASGKETPQDPRAPAAKVALLLKQTGINIEDYISCWAPSFNKVAEIVLRMTYQMSTASRKYKIRDKARIVTGGDPFDQITRDQMIAKTNIQSQAAGFAFDEINEKVNNLTLYDKIRPEVQNKPEAMYHLVRALIKSWSPQWRNKIDQIWPNPKEFNQQQFEMAIQAINQYSSLLKARKEATGVNPTPNFEELIGLMTNLQTQALTALNQEEVQKNAE